MLSESLLRSHVTRMNDSVQRDETSFKAQLSENGKTIAFFLLFVLVAGAVFACLIIMNGGLSFRILHVVGFVFLGYLQVRLHGGALHFLNARQVFTHTVVSTCVLSLFLYFVLFLFPAYSVLQLFSAVAAFVLPYTLTQLWQLYQLFSFGSGKTWAYSDNLPLQKSTTFLNSMPVKFKVQLEDGGDLQYQVSFRAPVRMPLGLIFYHMVRNQEASGGLPISLVDASNNPFQWVFQTSQFGFVRNLDPDAGLIENGIRQNMLVIARRLKQ